MALDRQRILGELGSVMKQLQSADCGCLGKLFGNSQQSAQPMMGSPLPTCGGCRRACCHGHGYGRYDSSCMNQPASNMNYPPMEGTNPSQQPVSGSMYGFGPQIVNMMKGDNSGAQNMTGQPQGQLQGQMQGQMPGQMPGQMSGNMPGQMQGQMAGLMPGQMQGQMSGQMPGQMQGQMPGQMQGQMPGQMQGQMPGQMQGQMPGPMQGQMPGQMQEQMPGQMQRQMPVPMTGQMPGQLSPMLIDAPQSPHGKIGLTPFTPPLMVQKDQIHPNPMNQGDIARQLQNQYTPLPQSNANAYSANTSPWPQQNLNSSPMAHQSSAHQSNPHTAGIAKFNQMFPGVKQGMGGDLGFDPMAIAIQMNPDNHLQSAMDTMNKIMNGSKGVDQLPNKPPAMQPGVFGNTNNQNAPAVNGTMQQNAIPKQVLQSNINQIPNQQPTGHNVIQSKESPNELSTNENIYGQPIPQQNQQIYAATVNANTVNQQIRSNDQQQYEQQQIMNMNAAAPNLPPIQQDIIAEENEFLAPIPESTGYPPQAPVRQIIKDPILPVDTSKNLINNTALRQQRNNNNYAYNTLGQPVEMLPAKLYHPPEPGLPQTLSPQPDPVKSRMNPMRGTNLKATVSKTSLMGLKPVGKTPSKAQLQQIYNQYKGSQSYTQQNLRHPGEGTVSAGKLNVLQTTKVPAVPVERVGGDTVVNNSFEGQNVINKVGQIMGQIGDVPASKPVDNFVPSKNSPDIARKGRNGLQDMVYTSYPSSAAWSFHGRQEYSPPRRLLRRRY